MQEVEKKFNSHGLNVVFMTHGIAYRIKDRVYLNKALLGYPEMLETTINHELRHSGKLSFEDLKMDLTEGDFISTALFCFKHPKAITHFIPISWHNGELAVDFNAIFGYLVILFLFFIILLL